MNDIYLDYASTTPIDPLVMARMADAMTLDGNFANPASTHAFGWRAREAVEKARRQVAAAIHCDARELVWTSGATEADNLAILGVTRHAMAAGRPVHVISSTIEHKAVLDTLKQAEREGARVTLLSPHSDGCVRPEQVELALSDDTVLVSLMHLNNEVGSLSPIAAIKAVLPESVLLHVDAAQTKGKAPIDLRAWGADLVSLSAHKSYGPKGIGALFVKRGLERQLDAMIHGGGHERGLRSGTLATHQIVGMGEAFALVDQLGDNERDRLRALKSQLARGLNDLGVGINGDSACDTIINAQFDGIDAETLMSALPNVAISSGSACNSADLSPSHVLLGMGLTRIQALSSLRFSIGRFTTPQQIDAVLSQLGVILAAQTTGARA
ncbi:cysteine desulfurase family protein [Litorivicinus lipolyticus]|uniref:cysteine desulfurase family protein n=1 Tax=Litorivicinus lipolyticus TaxID=418701 RepID=UPI003B5C1EC7